jgi:hypothetical protein
MAPILNNETESVRLLLTLGMLTKEVNCEKCVRGVMRITATSETTQKTQK